MALVLLDQKQTGGLCFTPSTTRGSVHIVKLGNTWQYNWINEHFSYGSPWRYNFRPSEFHHCTLKTEKHGRTLFVLCLLLSAYTLTIACHKPASTTWLASSALDSLSCVGTVQGAGLIPCMAKIMAGAKRLDKIVGQMDYLGTKKIREATDRLE